MHLPDPSYVSFGSAIVALATALTGLTTAILNRKPSKKTHLINFLR